VRDAGHHGEQPVGRRGRAGARRSRSTRPSATSRRTARASRWPVQPGEVGRPARRGGRLPRHWIARPQTWIARPASPGGGAHAAAGAVADERTLELGGRVVATADGDTLTLLAPEKRQVKVRLAAIDTLERRQPYGTRTRQALADLAFQREARMEVQDTDRYGRTVGRVWVGRTNINAELVRQEVAWVCRQYAHDPALLVLEQAAGDGRRGLRALPKARRIPPWEWRRHK